MKIAIYSLILNYHQANIADELWEITNHQFCFIELCKPSNENKKGDTNDYKNCPYLLKAWESNINYQLAEQIAQTSFCCIFSGIKALPFLKKRMKLGLLSFDMSERWLKQGIINLLSPTILKMFLTYKLNRWGEKPLYKLCCSAFAAYDQYKLGTYINKCYKWGYFTSIEKDVSFDLTISNPISIMWCSRYLKLKHAELPILLAKKLKDKGYNFILKMYGTGKYENIAKKFAVKLNIEKQVQFLGNIPNRELMDSMRKSDIFLFTSDRKEGWGAVANECMSNACVLIASDKIGSSPYLIQNEITGLLFRTPSVFSNFNNPDKKSLNSLYNQIEKILLNHDLLINIKKSAIKQMRSVWNPHEAAVRLLNLIDCLNQGQETKFNNGPCSKA